jgi:hypothetical protein
MIRKLSTKIGIISFALIIIIALSTIMVNAQPGDTVTVTVTPPPTDAPTITSFNVTVSQSDNNTTPPTNSDVKVSVSLNNVNLSTNTPDNADGPVTGMLRYCYDVQTIQTRLGPTITPSTPSVVPTVTDDSVTALPGNCLLTINKTITFRNVSAGEHIFSVELVNLDGSSMDPPVYFNTTMYVLPPQ